MTNELFEKILYQRLKNIKHVLGEKAKEYVRNGDRLHNFNVGSSITGDLREKVIWNGFALKHLVSVFDIVDDMDKGILPTEELVDEKVGDLINYLILLEASIKDRIINGTHR